jgi:hypothetical protein
VSILHLSLPTLPLPNYPSTLPGGKETAAFNALCLLVCLFMRLPYIYLPKQKQKKTTALQKSKKKKQNKGYQGTIE